MSGGARERRAPPAALVLRDPVNLLAFGFGTGLAPVAPGTVGSLPGLGLHLLLAGRTDLLAGLLIAASLFAAGVWLCGVCARRLGVHDHPGIVWDEITGCFLACTLAPPGLPWALAAFAAFRLFDITKPWPIRELDHGMPGGAGIMLDDAVAAVMAAGSLHAARGLLTGWT